MKRWGAVALALALAGCGGGKHARIAQHAAASPAQGAAPWRAPSNPIALTRRAGLTPETHEYVFLHIHSHLDVFVNGRRVLVPAAIGIEIHDPAVRRLKAADGSLAYGGISPPCGVPCISPLHTHDDSGILHTEAKENDPNTLGQFFTEWNVRLDRKCVGGYCKPAAPITVYVDRDPFRGDPRQITLEDRKEIVIVIGTLPAQIPSFFGR